MDKKEPVHEITIPKTHYFYQHEDDTYYSTQFGLDKDMNEGMVIVGEKVIPWGEYFAFINQYYDDEKSKYDRSQIEKDIAQFDFYIKS